MTGILARLRRPLRLPDMRPRSQIEADIDEELAAHVALRARDNEAAGMPPEQALREAELRFGDRQRIFAECRDIQLKERIVLQRINVALVAVLVVGMAASLWTGTRAQEAAQAQIAVLRSEVAALAGALRSGPAAGAASAEERAPAVHVLGKVRRPGEIPWCERMTLTKLIAISGDFEEFAKRTEVTIMRGSAPGGREVVNFDDIIEGKREDVRLGAEDLVYVPESFF